MSAKSRLSVCKVSVGLRRRELHVAVIFLLVCICQKNINANAM
ncbi:unnamed protein product, partial [Rotaria sp. Silwood1]